MHRIPHGYLLQLLLISAVGCSATKERVTTSALRNDRTPAPEITAAEAWSDSADGHGDEQISEPQQSAFHLISSRKIKEIEQEEADPSPTANSDDQQQTDDEPTVRDDPLTGDTLTGDVPPNRPGTGRVRPYSSGGRSRIFDEQEGGQLPENAVEHQIVVDSVYQSYPLLAAAMFSRNVALGQQVAAFGAFDTNLRGASENGPTGFYQTYRHSLGVTQPTMWGGELFAGYRIGRGDFQPWYQERQTNDGGEFRAGVLVPLARNRNIDQRRAELWKAGYERQLVEPDIQAQLIGFVQEASYAYWEWVAAGENHRIAVRILETAEDRTERIRQQVEAEFLDPPELIDNLRLVAIRRAKVADTRRKQEQTAAKLSVYLRDINGMPFVPAPEQSPGFPLPTEMTEEQLQSDIQLALVARPELRFLDFVRRQIDVDYAQATNQLQPELDAVIMGSQDVGGATSLKKDKSEFEGEAALYLDVPLQRRRARGRMIELQGKVAQINAKRRLAGDKIVVDVQLAYAALVSALEQVDLTREAVDRAEELVNREQEQLDAGVSDMLTIAIREQFAVESAEREVEALLLYFIARADYRAALAQDQVP